MLIAIDTETTHYDPKIAQVLEIGAVTEFGHTFSMLCNPQLDLSQYKGALDVNHIDPMEIYSAPPSQYVAQLLKTWLTQFNNIELVGYNSINFDAPILNKQPWSIPISWWAHDVMLMCTTEMHKKGLLKVHPYYHTPKWVSLSKAVEHYNIIIEGDAHRALTDAKCTLHLLQHIMEDNK